MLCVCRYGYGGVIYVCCVYVGMDMEGLFRVPGPAALLDELRVAFEEGRVLACTDICDPL